MAAYGCILRSGKSSRVVPGLVGVAALLLSTLASPASASPITTLNQILGDYYVYIGGDIGSAGTAYSSTDSQGPIAVGGNAYFSSFTADGNSITTAPALTVGGNLTFSNGSIDGSAFVGGNASVQSAGVSGSINYVGSTSGNNVPTWISSHQVASIPLNFAATTSDLRTASTYLASTAAMSQGTTGVVTTVYGNQLTLTGTSTGINYFTLTAAQLASLGSGSLTIKGPAGSTAIINVSGVNITIGSPGNFGISVNGGISMSDILWNFPTATSILMKSFDGSILAPNATVTFTNGALDGSLIAASLTGASPGGEFDGSAYAGSLPLYVSSGGVVSNVPEPSSLMLLLGSVALAFFAARGRGHKAAAASANSGRRV